MCELFKLGLADLQNGLLHRLSKALLIIMTYDVLLHGLSAYTRHQPDLKEKKCLISTKLLWFCLHL